MDYQLLYLVKQGRITKIGITDNSKERFSAIKSDTKAPINVLFVKRLPYTKSIEKWLHVRYKAQKRRHVGRGKEEWFKLNIFQRFFIVLVLNLLWLVILILFSALFFVTLFGALTLLF